MPRRGFPCRPWARAGWEASLQPRSQRATRECGKEARSESDGSAVLGEEKQMATFIWPGSGLLLLQMWDEEPMSWEDSDISCLERTSSCRARATEQSKLSPVIRGGWGPVGTDQGFPGSSRQQPSTCPALGLCKNHSKEMQCMPAPMGKLGM